MFYKNISYSAKTFYGVTFQPGETKKVDGCISSKWMILVDEPATQEKVQQKPSPEEPKKEAEKSEEPKQNAKQQEAKGNEKAPETKEQKS